MNYSIFHIETYGHGKNRQSDHEGTVTIQNHDGYYDVYECDTDETAEQIANWYLSAVYEHYPEEVTLDKHNPRYFSIEVADHE